MYANEFINEVMITVFYCKSSVNKFGLMKRIFTNHYRKSCTMSKCAGFIVFFYFSSSVAARHLELLPEK